MSTVHKRVQNRRPKESMRRRSADPASYLDYSPNILCIILHFSVINDQLLLSASPSEVSKGGRFYNLSLSLCPSMFALLCKLRNVNVLSAARILATSGRAE